MDMLGGSTNTSGGGFWNTVASKPESLGKEYTGPDYNYAKYIKTPMQLGMSSKASAIADNVAGIMDYVTMLTEGGGPASKNDGLPLGDRYFLSTGGKCKTASGDVVQRSLYVNNVPDGSIPFLSDMNIKLSSFKGLVPGVLGDLNTMNPVHLFSAFTQSTTPPCTNIHASVIGANNVASEGSGFVLDSEVKQIAPCAFVNGRNPLTGGVCIESFINANKKLRNKKKKSRKHKKISLHNKPLANLYTALVGGVLIYIIYRLVERK